MRRLLVLVALAGGCAHTPGWSELTSRHFALRTDLPPRVARAALSQFESTYSALELLAFATNPPRERIDLILFRHEAELRALAPTGATGYFMPHQLDEPDAVPTIAMFGELNDATQRRFTHELTHRFMDHQLHGAPPWLEEGLAEYYSTMRPRADGVVIGLLPNAKLFRLDFPQDIALSGRYVDARVELDTVPSVQALLAADGDTFHRLDHEVAYYFASWTLVHMMLHGPHEYRPRFTRFVSALIAGTPAAEAWQHEFGDLDADRLDAALRLYIVRLYLEEKNLRLRLPVDVGEVASERRLRDDEVHLMFARIRPWDSRENIFAAGRELAMARKLAGADAPAELHFWSALYAERWRRFHEAETELDRALQRDPNNARYWLALAELVARPDRLDALETARLDFAVEHLLPLATSGEALGFLAHYFAERGEAERALPLAQRAAALSPDCHSCAETLTALRSLVPHDAPPARDLYTRPSIE